MNLAVHSADDTSTRTMDTQNSDFDLRSKNSEKKNGNAGWFNRWDEPPRILNGTGSRTGGKMVEK